VAYFSARRAVAEECVLTVMDDAGRKTSGIGHGDGPGLRDSRGTNIWRQDGPTRPQWTQLVEWKCCRRRVEAESFVFRRRDRLVDADVFQSRRVISNKMGR